METGVRISSLHDSQLRVACRVLKSTNIRDLLDAETTTQQTDQLLMMSRRLREFSQQTRAHASAVRQRAVANRAALEEIHILP